LRRSVRGEALAEDAARIAVLIVGAPDGREVALGIAADGRSGLAIRRRRVDLKLRAGECAAACEPLPEDPVAVAVLPVTFPSDHEVAAGAAASRWIALAADGVRVHLELGADGSAAAGEAL